MATEQGRLAAIRSGLLPRSTKIDVVGTPGRDGRNGTDGVGIPGPPGPAGANGISALTFYTTFTNASLTGNFLQFAHNLDSDVPIVQVVDNNNRVVVVNEIEFLDLNNAQLDLTGLTPIAGTWRLRCLA